MMMVPTIQFLYIVVPYAVLVALSMLLSGVLTLKMQKSVKMGAGAEVVKVGM